MTAHPFLSPEWIIAMREIRADYANDEGAPDIQLAANVTVTNPPFGEGSILGHIDSSGPTLMIEEGHLDQPEFSLEVRYELAHQFFVQRDPTAVMPAIFAGQIKLTGDSSKVLMLAAQMAPPPEDDPRRGQLREIVARIDAITA
ncbi:MAG: hypothetical protein HOH36_09380 [Acidimicrobiaceae bacterium]|nr:hypothetical protein [Acidimicrobiaceae bacterium]MBT5582300.1 hypothetical protein [Acidimicrobiaceae bacterium]MBT5850633.1 hypothetical protein [Acidimicrobiaceae bacterium]